MDKSKSRYFVALLPPKDIRTQVNSIKQYFADHYGSWAAFKSPPHITLQPPFEWLAEEVPVLEQCLSEFATKYPSIPITLSGFGAFVPRVIYVNVIKTPALLTLQADLMTHLETTLGITDPKSKQRPYAPHMTVAFRDLSRQNFKAAWPEFQDRELHFEFIAGNLTLLIHDGKQWNIHSEFPFQPQTQPLEV